MKHLDEFLLSCLWSVGMNTMGGPADTIRSQQVRQAAKNEVSP